VRKVIMVMSRLQKVWASSMTKQIPPIGDRKPALTPAANPQLINSLLDLSFLNFNYQFERMSLFLNRKNFSKEGRCAKYAPITPPI